MAEVKQHPQGMLCWAELATRDEKGALRFYETLFGWKDNPQPMGPGAVYHMEQLRGLDAAAMCQLSEEERKQHVPPHWRTYFAVTSVDDAVKRANQAGGQVIAGPFDVFEAGRMAFIRDPQGAVFGVWQARGHIGSRISGEPGAMCWGDLRTTDSKKAATFYSTVLGVQATRFPGMEYTVLKAAGKESAGMMEITKEMGPIPPNWMVYFAVADADATTKKAQSLGGKVMMGPQDIPGGGRFAVLQDPQGAVFTVRSLPTTG